MQGTVRAGLIACTRAASPSTIGHMRGNACDMWGALRQALKSGHAIKAVVQLVGGSTSGFAHVAEAYWTTIVVTIVVSVVCLALAIATYVFRMDQRMRQDRHYGKGVRGEASGSVVCCDLAAGCLLISACHVARYLRCEQAQRLSTCAEHALHICTQKQSAQIA